MPHPPTVMLRSKTSSSQRIPPELTNRSSAVKANKAIDSTGPTFETAEVCQRLLKKVLVPPLRGVAERLKAFPTDVVNFILGSNSTFPPSVASNGTVPPERFMNAVIDTLKHKTQG